MAAAGLSALSAIDIVAVAVRSMDVLARLR
jgi:hypothetical protein